VIRPQKQATKPATIPAPMSGMTSDTNLLSMQPSDSIYTFNMLAGDYGLDIREGYVSASVSIPVEGNSQVRTVIGYRGTKDDGSLNRLYAVTNLGIYNASDATQIVAFSTTTGAAGYGVYTTYAPIGGSYLFYCDEANGGFRYAEDENEWLPIPDLTLDGVAFDPSRIVNVTAWKNRVWFTVRDSAVAYYLPIGQISGALTPFDFGNKFPSGGSLVGVWNWTIEGGNGPNDYLVALSRGGDVLVYQGLDPSNAASFGGKGSWFVGALPAGRSIVYNYGGDLLILTLYGVISLKAILGGSPFSDEGSYITKRIGRFIREEMEQSKSAMGWTITQHPRLGYLMVAAPPRAGVQPIQFVRAVGGSWTIFKGIPAYCVSEYLGELYIGSGFDQGHKLYRLEGDLDVTKPIVWSLVTSYSGYGVPANTKRAQFIRAMFVGSMTPVYEVKALYDFDLSVVTGSPKLPDVGTGIWDASMWDKAVWGAGYISDQKPYGGSGMGRHIAVAIRGASIVPTTLLGFDIMMDVGGMM
jgi:hypothetical protein